MPISRALIWGIVDGVRKQTEYLPITLSCHRDRRTHRYTHTYTLLLRSYASKMGCGPSKVKLPTQTQEEREIRGLVDDGRDKVRDSLLQLVKNKKNYDDHPSYVNMSDAEKSDFTVLFSNYSFSQGTETGAANWDNEFKEKWNDLWETGSGLKWRQGKSGDPKKLFGLSNTIMQI